MGAAASVMATSIHVSSRIARHCFERAKTPKPFSLHFRVSCPQQPKVHGHCFLRMLIQQFLSEIACGISCKHNTSSCVYVVLCGFLFFCRLVPVSVSLAPSVVSVGVEGIFLSPHANQLTKYHVLSSFCSECGGVGNIFVAPTSLAPSVVSVGV